MPRQKFAALFAGLLMAVYLLAGCAARPLPEKTPPWYLQPSGAYNTSYGRVFYGIGKAEGSSSFTLLHATAMNHARQEMYKVLDSYAVELFQAAGAMPVLSMEDGEQLIGALVRSAMMQAVISDQYSDPGQARLFALCRLDLETFKKVLESQTDMSPEVLEAMRSKADQVHEQLERR